MNWRCAGNIKIKLKSEDNKTKDIFGNFSFSACFIRIPFRCLQVRGSCQTALASLLLFYSSVNYFDEHVNCYLISSTVGNDDVGIFFGGFDKLIMHGFDTVAILF